MTETDALSDRATPTQIPPEAGVLDLEDYLAMQSALADETQFRVLYALTETESADCSELAELLDTAEDRVQSSLEELVDVGLAENWIRNGPDTDGVYSYYRASSLGEGLLNEGIGELICTEWTYSTATPDTPAANPRVFSPSRQNSRAWRNSPISSSKRAT